MRDPTLHSRSAWLDIFDAHLANLQEASISMGYWDNVEDKRRVHNHLMNAARRALMRDITFILDALRLAPEGKEASC